MIRSTTRYFRQGVPGVDAESPEAPLQGVTVLVATCDPTTGEFLRVQRGADGQPALGYKAEEISAAAAAVWFERMKGAAANPVEGFEDQEGRWYPGAIGAGISVINAEGQAHRVAAMQAARAALANDARDQQRITPRQAREALIRLNLDESVEAALMTLSDTDCKLVRNWFEYTTEWEYGNQRFAQLAAALGLDRDEFFALAQTL